MVVEQAQGGIPIYVSYLTFINFLDWLKEMTVVPSQIDRSLWSSKFSGSNGAQLMVGLRFLGLLEGEKPEPELEPLAMADDASRKQLIKAVLERAYGEELIRELPRTTPGMLDKRLGDLGTTGPTHRKAVSFFVNAAKAIGLSVPVGISKKARNKPSPAKAGTSRTNGRAEKPKPKEPDPSEGSGGKTDVELPVASQSLMLWGLFQSLPAPGAVFGDSEQEKWIGAAKAIFAVEYKAEESPNPETQQAP